MSLITVNLDFETRSELDVTKVGALKYASHPSTQVMCLAYRVTGEQPTLVTEHDITDLRLQSLARNPNVVFKAYNAGFERNIWKYCMHRHGYAPIPLHRWRCTAAKAARASLPRALVDSGAVLKLKKQKDMTGHNIMKQLSRPRRASKDNPNRFYRYEDVPEKFERLYRYNIDDVESENAVDMVLPDLEPEEQEIWFLNEEMNDRGLRLDRAAILKAVQFLRREGEVIRLEFEEITGGEVETPLQRAKWKAWLQKNGVDVTDTQGKTLSKILAIDDTLPLIPRHVRTAIELAQQLGKTSTSKFSSMLRSMTDEDRVHNHLIYYGADRTGRWAGAIIQPQNFKRIPKGFDIDQAIEDLKTLEYRDFKRKYPNVLETISVSVRGMIIPSEGYELYVADYSGIESRMLAWLAGQQDLVELFEELDFGLAETDNYCQSASEILNRKITKEDDHERQMGKVAELSLGYNGGIAAFALMAVNYGLDLESLYPLVWPTATTAERKRAKKAYKLYLKTAAEPVSRQAGLAVDVIKQRYRKKRYAIRDFWGEMGEAAIAAVEQGGKHQVRDGLYFQVVGKKRKFLRLYLPSGRYLSYYDPKIKHQKNRWGKIQAVLTYVGKKNGKTIRLTTYGGKLVENTIQAIARDLMAGAFVRIRKADFHPLLLVHDEAVAEAPIGFAKIDKYNSILRQKPLWAKTCPIEVEGFITQRYKKAA